MSSQVLSLLCKNFSNLETQGVCWEAPHELKDALSHQLKQHIWKRDWIYNKQYQHHEKQLGAKSPSKVEEQE